MSCDLRTVGVNPLILFMNEGFATHDGIPAPCFVFDELELQRQLTRGPSQAEHGPARARFHVQEFNAGVVQQSFAPLAQLHFSVAI